MSVSRGEGLDDVCAWARLSLDSGEPTGTQIKGQTPSSCSALLKSASNCFKPSKAISSGA
eukprot:1988694-Alexandrium_andersonii.AAC.1